MLPRFLMLSLLLSLAGADVRAAPADYAWAPTRGFGSGAWPDASWPLATPAEMQMDAALLHAARDYALTGGGAGMVLRRGRLVLAWGDLGALYPLKSTTKSIGGTALGLAIGDGRLALDDLADPLHPDFGLPPNGNAATGWLGEITLSHLASQTAGFLDDGGYGDLLFEAGTKWSYSDGGPNWLAEVLTLEYGEDLSTLLWDRVFGPIGVAPGDLVWRNHAYRPDLIGGIKRREIASGISASIHAMSRIGTLYLRRGHWNGEQIVPEAFVDTVGAPVPENIGLPELAPAIEFDASDHYGVLWWTNGDGTLVNVPSDAYWSWGVGDSLIVVIPSLDVVAVRAGGAWVYPSFVMDYGSLEPFIEPIALSVQPGAAPSDCSDGTDNDGDGAVDHPADRGCQSAAASPEDPPCQNGLDDDGDGVGDFPDDPECGGRSDVSEGPACSDAFDNDGDGSVDFPADASCPDPSGLTEHDPACGLGTEVALALLVLLVRLRRTYVTSGSVTPVAARITPSRAGAPPSAGRSAGSATGSGRPRRRGSCRGAPR